MHLTNALHIAKKATNLFAQTGGAKAPVFRYSDVGVTSLRAILDAMQLEMADQYQVQISTCHRTISQFKEVAETYSALSATILYGSFLPDSVYDRIVQENHDPNKLFHALMGAPQAAESVDLGQLETPLSFYEFLTSLDPVSPTYWQKVYERLHLAFDSNAVPPHRIYFRPENIRPIRQAEIPSSPPEQLSTSAQVTETKAVEHRSRRGILQGLFEKIVFNASITLPRDHAEYLAKICHSAAAKSFAQVSRENNPSMFVSAVGTTCQRWDEDIHRMLNETSSPKITVSIRKKDIDYILPALNAEATEFGFRADQTSDLEKAKSFRANQDFCSFLIQSLQCQIP